MADNQTPPNNPQNPVTEAELHYKSLTDYFKFLVTLTLTVTLGGIGILIRLACISATKTWLPCARK